MQDPDSLLNWYRSLIRLRAEEPALHSGDYRRLSMKEEVFCFERRWGGDRILVALNFSGKERKVSLPETGSWKPLLREGLRSDRKLVEPQLTDRTTLSKYGVLIAKNSPD